MEEVVEDLSFLSNDRQDIDYKRMTGDRGETCFFYPFSPRMTLETAAELERRYVQHRENRRLAKWSIFWGVVGALIGATAGSVITRLLGK